MIAFIRDEGTKRLLVTGLKERGMGGLAGFIERTALPTFAAGRWGTLAKACRAAAVWLPSLAENFDSAPFVKAKDQTRFKLVLDTMSKGFLARNEFVCWFTDHMDRLLQYGGACECH